MPQPPGTTRRHRWFIAVFAMLAVAPLLLTFAPVPLPVKATAIVLALPAMLIWMVKGQSWVWAAAPLRPVDAVATARQVGHRTMVMIFVSMFIIEFVSWGFGARQGGATEALLKTFFTGAGQAFIGGKMAEYFWSRRPADAPTPWLFRVWPLEDRRA